MKNVFLDLWPNLYIGSWRSHISSFSPIEDTLLKLQGFLYTFLELIIYQETIVVMKKKEPGDISLYPYITHTSFWYQTVAF